MPGMHGPLTSRLRHSAHSFDDISRFLREGLADEESRQLRDSLVALSQHIETAVRVRRRRSDPSAILHSVDQLVACASEHQRFLTGLGSAWHAMYELGVYQSTLRELRDAIAAWQSALERRSSAERTRFDAFEVLAWRAVGEALLLIDMYEHGAVTQGTPLERAAPPAARGRTRSWMERLRAWWRRRA